MAGSLSDYAENKVLDHLVGKTAYAKPTISVALYTTAPTDSTAGVEVSGGGYNRVVTAASDWNAASGGSISNAVDFLWPTATANWGTVVAIALTDGTNVILYGTAQTAKVISEGDQYRVASGNLVITLD